ncbi:Serine protease gd [Eufriesea mexicana]|uniref:Serine protease gd n=1 Tax=Eufriesea mexicana TaxID=516756 RepID=A0A310SEP6_9HYME|nr:Serine protease gd [Eufriesea mexicana]
MLFPEAGETGLKKGKRKFIKCSRSRLNGCRQTLKYLHKYGTRPQCSRMVSVIVKAVLLVHFLQLIAEVACQSPCSDYFQYIQNDTNNETVGLIQIRSPPKGVALQLSVKMSIAAALPTKYVGRLELNQPAGRTVQAIMQGKPLRYKIYFPLREPIPSLTGNGPIVTIITLNHTLYPPGTYPLVNRETTNIETVPRQPISTVATTTPVNKQENNLDCGRPSNLNKVNPLIAGGVKTRPGQWPWVAAIFVSKRNFGFYCGGSLVSNRHVITAAHCTKFDKADLHPSSFMVALGRYRLRDWNEKDSVNREVAEYKVHPNYNMDDNADSDLAVFILKQRVEYSAVIRPICLWSGSSELENVVGMIGSVVGWGQDELGNRYVQEPRLSKSPIISQEDCLRSNDNFITVTSNRTFCAGFRDGTGPCNGDSGSGFVIHDIITNRYYLRGVVSMSLGTYNEIMPCDLTQYVVYVDVAKYMNWIQTQMSYDIRR